MVISHILFIECFIVFKMVQALYFQQYLFLVSDYHLMMLPAERGYFVFLIIYLTTLWKFGIFENILDIHIRPYLLLLIVLKMQHHEACHIISKGPGKPCLIFVTTTNLCKKNQPSVKFSNQNAKKVLYTICKILHTRQLLQQIYALCKSFLVSNCSFVK